MQEVFYEECAKCANYKKEKTKYSIVNIMSYVSFGLAILWVFIVINFVNIQNVNLILTLVINLIPSVIMLVAGILLFKFKNRFCIDYDYTFVSGSIRISKVVNNKNRFSLVKFNTEFIEKVGLSNSKEYNNYLNNPSIKQFVYTSNQEPEEGKNFYYIVAVINSERRMFIIETSSQFIINILRFSKRTVRDQELV